MCRYGAVAAMGAARTAAVLQVLGASGAARLVAAMDPTAAAASLLGVGSGGFVAEVVARVPDVRRAADLIPLMIAESPAFVAEVLTFDDDEGGGGANTNTSFCGGLNEADALAAVASAVPVDYLADTVGVLWEHLDTPAAAGLAQRMSVEAAAEALASCSDSRLASGVVEAMEVSKAAEVLCRMAEAGAPESAVSLLDHMPPAAAVLALQNMAAMDGKSTAQVVGCKTEVHPAAAATWMLQLGTSAAATVLNEKNGHISAEGRMHLAAFVDDSPFGMLQDFATAAAAAARAAARAAAGGGGEGGEGVEDEGMDRAARLTATLVKKEEELAALRLAVASLDAQLRLNVSDDAKAIDVKVTQLVSNAMRAKAESNAAQSEAAVAAAEVELNRAKAALAEAETRGDRAELRAFRTAVDAAQKRKELEETVGRLLRNESQLEATVQALRQELASQQSSSSSISSATAASGAAASSAAAMSAALAAISAAGAANHEPVDTGAEYDPNYVSTMLRRDPSVYKKAETLKDSFVDALVTAVLRYLNNTVGCEGVLGRAGQSINATITP